MGKALEIAKQSRISNPADIPVGCVVVRGGEIIGAGANTRECACKITGHAEINALEATAAATGSRYLDDCQVFVTLEPCPMCAGALRAARVNELYFGAYNPKEGAAGSVYQLLSPQIEVYGGILKDRCELLLKEYFTALRGQ